MLDTYKVRWSGEMAMPLGLPASAISRRTAPPGSIL